MTYSLTIYSGNYLLNEWSRVITLHMRRVKNELPKEAIDRLPDLLSGLSADFRPLLGPALAAQSSALGLDSDHLFSTAGSGMTTRNTLFGEVYGVSGGVVAVHAWHEQARRYLGVAPETPRKGTVTAFSAGAEGVEEALDEVVALLERDPEVEFEDFAFQSQRFKELKEEGMTSPQAPSTAEVAGARILSDPAARRTALAIASSGGLMVRDLPRHLQAEERDRAEEIELSLQEGDLVSSDLMIVCSKTGEQVLRAPDQEALDQAAAAGVRCACGATVEKERTEEALSLTGLGRHLLDGSWWMTVLLMEELGRLGIGRNAMLVEQIADGDEVDCFADVSGALVIFELKDKEFSLGNAYSFGSKFAIHKPAYAVVVTTANVGNDAKEHFKKAFSAGDDRLSREAETRIEYVEGLDQLQGGLDEIVGSIFGGDAEMLLREILPGASADPSAVVQAINEKNRPSAEATETEIAHSAEEDEPVAS